MVHSVSSQRNCKQTNAMCVVRLSSTECGSSQGEQCCQKYHSTHQRTYKEVKCRVQHLSVLKNRPINTGNLFSERRSGGWCFIRTNQLPVHYITLRSALCLYFLCGFVFICNAPCGASRTNAFHPIKI